MRLHTNLKWVVAVGLVVLASGSATAQPLQPAPASPAPSTPSTNAGTTADVPFEQHPTLSPQEEADQADAMLSRMDQASQTVQRQLQTAREARDVVKTLCLNDKLSQIDVAIRSSRDRQSGLRGAVTRTPPDTEFANHEFTILTVMKQRVDQLVTESNQCLGEELSFVGATQVVTQIDPNLPGDDVTFYPSTEVSVTWAPPQCISCNQ